MSGDYWLVNNRSFGSNDFQASRFPSIHSTGRRRGRRINRNSAVIPKGGIDGTVSDSDEVERVAV